MQALQALLSRIPPLPTSLPPGVALPALPPPPPLPNLLAIPHPRLCTPHLGLIGFCLP
jgi:hypothetical protein